ncbi:MAG TPA: hypothetical protein VI111_09940 [Thermoleophilaceae bacterium]
MAGSEITQAHLGALVRAGGYVVDEHAVADAMVRSGVLVATQPRDWVPVWTLEDQTAPAGDHS